MPNPPDPSQQQASEQINRLRSWRNPRLMTRAFSHLEQQVNREIITPHRKLGPLRDAWLELLPPELEQRTQLLALHRHILRIAVADSATMYELQQRLSMGLQNALKQQARVNFRSVRLEIDPSLDDTILD